MFEWLVRKFITKDIIDQLDLIVLRLENLAKNQEAFNRRLNLVEESLKSLPGDIYDYELVNPDMQASAFPPGVPEIIFDSEVK